MLARTWIPSRNTWCNCGDGRSLYYPRDFGNRRPRVGLLSVGEEEIKGNELTREGLTLGLKKSPVHFVGNVEGGDLFSGNVDVIVSDGFVGNIALKICEGLGLSNFWLAAQIHQQLAGFAGGWMLSKVRLQGPEKKRSITARSTAARRCWACAAYCVIRAPDVRMPTAVKTPFAVDRGTNRPLQGHGRRKSEQGALRRPRFVA